MALKNGGGGEREGEKEKPDFPVHFEGGVWSGAKNETLMLIW